MLSEWFTAARRDWCTYKDPCVEADVSQSICNLQEGSLIKVSLHKSAKYMNQNAISIMKWTCHFRWSVRICKQYTPSALSRFISLPLDIPSFPSSNIFKQTALLHLSVIRLHLSWQLFLPSDRSRLKYFKASDCLKIIVRPRGNVYVLSQKWYDALLHTFIGHISVKFNMSVCDDAHGVDRFATLSDVCLSLLTM